jgi:hypothetical protein
LISSSFLIISWCVPDCFVAPACLGLLLRIGLAIYSAGAFLAQRSSAHRFVLRRIRPPLFERFARTHLWFSAFFAHSKHPALCADRS